MNPLCIRYCARGNYRQILAVLKAAFHSLIEKFAWRPTFNLRTARIGRGFIYFYINMYFSNRKKTPIPSSKLWPPRRHRHRPSWIAFHISGFPKLLSMLVSSPRHHLRQSSSVPFKSANQNTPPNTNPALLTVPRSFMPTLKTPGLPKRLTADACCRKNCRRTQNSSMPSSSSQQHLRKSWSTSLGQRLCEQRPRAFEDSRTCLFQLLQSLPLSKRMYSMRDAERAANPIRSVITQKTFLLAQEIPHH